MCESCGCGVKPHDHDHSGTGHGHDHTDTAERRSVDVAQSVLAHNDRLAEQNRGMFKAHRLAVINLLSAPGSGKTALLERTAADLGKRVRMGVIVGDLQTDNDARRIARHGIRAVQISTGTACHLDAHMVQHALEDLDLQVLDLLFIENVGNLVCPATFDLGERARAVVMSVTEGEDKPLKYPVIFLDAAVVLVNKMDLAAATGFDRDTALANIRHAAPKARVLEVSAKTGEGMPAWYAYLESLLTPRNGAR
jgi:hydrogenase nickel incorporation protein HypB